MNALYALPQYNELAPKKLVRLDQIANPVLDDLVSVNRHIDEQLASDVALIRQMGAYLISGGGKQLRPITLLLATKALHYRGTDHITLAAVIELIHTATLMHDDVVDKSELRRGQQTGNSMWGNAASVLVGDFMYSRAFEMMVTVNRMRVMEIMASTTNAIAEGEVMQLLHLNSPNIDETEYLATIERKTARLFQSSTKLAAVIAGTGVETEKALTAFGLNLGIAFQISDDLLDYGPSSRHLGKNPGDDLAEGKCTLPLIHALKNASNKEKQLICSAINDGDRENFETIRKIIESTGSVAYCSRRARDFAETAKSELNKLPESIYVASLRNLADFSVSRLH